MIGFLKGILVHKQPPMLVVDVQGIGYEVEAPMSTFYQLENNSDTVTILTHMHVREDAILLYGFATEAERTLFKTLIKVNGVGAKMALGILSAMSVNEFCSSVNAADVTSLTRIPGVGKKTAERLQIEMRDRLKPIMDSGVLQLDASPSGTTATGDVPSVLFSGIQQSACDALISLGYKASQAEKMVQGVFEESLSLEEVIKRALQGIKLP
jgi:Holliday junction DNA helicase RuvA